MAKKKFWDIVMEEYEKSLNWAVKHFNVDLFREKQEEEKCKDDK